MQKVTSRDTKSEIITAYNELAKQYKALEKQKGAAPSAGAAPAADDDGEMSIADIVTRLRGLTTSIGESASLLQTELTAEATVLNDVRDQASGIVKELETLHQIEVGPDSLDTLIAQYMKTSEAAEAELSDKRSAFEKDRSAAKTAWKKEKDEHGREAKEAAGTLKKTRQRNGQEYKYDVELEHKQQEDDTQQGQKHFSQELADLEENKNAQWAERENKLQEQEKELAELEAKAAAFDGELEAAVKKAEQEGSSIARRQTKSQAELKNKDTEAIRRVFELKIESLEHTIGKQEQQVEELSRQLVSAREQTTALAVKAIDGASNASSLESMKEIALEQAKNTQKGK
jgi:hypothetical protein